MISNHIFSLPPLLPSVPQLNSSLNPTPLFPFRKEKTSKRQQSNIIK